MGCCVVDDGYGVVNKLDIDEPPHGCNDMTMMVTIMTTMMVMIVTAMMSYCHG